MSKKIDRRELFKKTRRALPPPTKKEELDKGGKYKRHPKHRRNQNEPE
jgi:hypothetical protein